MTIKCVVQLPGCKIKAVEYQQHRVIIEAQTTTGKSYCPACSQASTHVHSYRVRCLNDLPMSTYEVQLRIRVKRFRCQNTTCARRTWTETIPGIVESYARRTARLDHSLWHIAHALGGKAGSRLAHLLRMPASRDTLLRLLRAVESSISTTPRIIGIDDWAKRKGQCYGTIIVDLERRCVIDLLPDREAQTVANWLEQHKEIEIVARDRSAEYALGIRQGAPQAIQVADRWHLLKNLWDVVDRSLNALRKSGHQQVVFSSTSTRPREPFPRAASEEAARRAKRELRITQYHRVHYLRDQGHSTRRIAKRLGISRGTVLRYLEADTFPAIERRYVPSILDPFLPYLEQRVAEGCTHTKQLWQEIQAQGYPGSAKQVDKWLRLQRRKSTIAPPKDITKPLVSQAMMPHAKTMIRLMMSKPEQLDAHDTALLNTVTRDERFKALYLHVQQFITLLQKRDARHFDDWLNVGQLFNIPPYRNFVKSLAHDYDAVKSAIELCWSNGQTEGQIHRLKLLKRQMYGRAKLDLLRIRLMQPP